MNFISICEYNFSVFFCPDILSSPEEFLEVVNFTLGDGLRANYTHV
jgi:hypothetical protein